MGIWGYGLYDNDIALDTRELYLSQLELGKTNEDATREVFKHYGELFDDSDDAPLFWYALADTQWSCGLLELRIRDRALFYIRSFLCMQDIEVEWRKTLVELEKRLISSQQSPKVLSSKKLFHCKWAIGDTYLYVLSSSLAKEKSLAGSCLFIQKVAETTWHPGHTVPIVYIKIASPNVIPMCQSDFEQLEYIQTGFTRYEDRFLPIDNTRLEADIFEKSQMQYEVDAFGFLPEYRMILVTTNVKDLPKTLRYIGNFSAELRPKGEFIPHSDLNLVATSWKDFERKIIARYCGHNRRELPIYTK